MGDRGKSVESARETLQSTGILRTLRHAPSGRQPTAKYPENKPLRAGTFGIENQGD